MGSQAMPGTAMKAQHGCLAEMDNLGAQYAGWGAKYGVQSTPVVSCCCSNVQRIVPLAVTKLFTCKHF